MISNSLTIEQKINDIYNEVVNGDKTLDFLNVIAIFVGFYNLYLNRQQIDNNAIMKELDKQDTVYFERIIKLLEEIKERYNDNK